MGQINRSLSSTPPDACRTLRPAVLRRRDHLIHQASRGIPRAINNLAVQALIAAYADGKGIIDQSAAKAAVAEVTAD
jgi:hypothetical protein